VLPISNDVKHTNFKMNVVVELPYSTSMAVASSAFAVVFAFASVIFLVLSGRYAVGAGTGSGHHGKCKPNQGLAWLWWALAFVLSGFAYSAGLELAPSIFLSFAVTVVFIILIALCFTDSQGCCSSGHHGNDGCFSSCSSNKHHGRSHGRRHRHHSSSSHCDPSSSSHCDSSSSSSGRHGVYYKSGSCSDDRSSSSSDC
jgi:hypothetical protein